MPVSPPQWPVRLLLGALLFLVALGAAWSLPPEGGETEPARSLAASACPDTLPLLRLEGDPYARGFQHGQALRRVIRQRGERMLQAWASAGVQRPSLALLPSVRTTLLPEVRQEVQGIADGAGVSRETVLLLNLWQPGETPAGGFFLAFAEAESGSRYLGWMGEGPCQDAVLLVHRTAEGDAYMVLGRAGQVGGILGANRAGLAGVAREASTRDRRTWGVPTEMLLALGLARASTVDEAVSQVAQARRAGGGAILWAEGAGSARSLVEFTAHRYALEVPPEAFLWQGFRDPWLQEFALFPPAERGAEERAEWLEDNREWIGQGKAWAWLKGEVQGPGRLAALLDVASARLWVAFGCAEGGTVELGPVALEEFFAEAQ